MIGLGHGQRGSHRAANREAVRALQFALPDLLPTTRGWTLAEAAEHVMAEINTQRAIAATESTSAGQWRDRALDELGQVRKLGAEIVDLRNDGHLTVAEIAGLIAARKQADAAAAQLRDRIGELLDLCRASEAAALAEDNDGGTLAGHLTTATVRRVLVGDE